MTEAVNESRATWLTPVVIFVLAAVIYVPLSTLTAVPSVAPDEFFYGHLARSVGNGEGLTWYGVDQAWRMVLYIYLLAPSWALASGEDAYTLAKATGAIAACAAVFPVWVLARELIPGRDAAVPALLAVAGTWMIAAGGLLTENLAYPLGTTAFVCTVLALREPERRWIWAAMAFASLATLTRAQMAVAFPIILAALLLDVAWAERPAERLARHRVPAALLGVAVLIGIVAVLTGSSLVLGLYTVVADLSPAPGQIIRSTGDQWLALTVVCGVLPLVALLVVAASPAAWRDREMGPLLCVTVPAVLLLVVESGYFNAGIGNDGVDWSIERYVQYAVPMLLIVLFAALHRGLLPARRLALAGAAVALTLLATRELRQVFEERARFATSDVLGLDTWLALPLLALLVTGGALLAVHRVPRPRAVLTVGGLMLTVLLLQSQAIWRWQVDITDQVRAQYPERLTWVDDHAQGPVSRMYLFQNSALFQAAELFNESVEQDLGPSVPIPGVPPAGPLCSWTASPRGVVQPSDGCRPLRRTIWNDDPFILMSFHGGRFLARDPNLGQLIAVPAEPRLRSLIRQPCQRVTLLLDRTGSAKGTPRDLPCQPNISINLWLDAPSDLRLTFSGGTRPQRVRIGSRSWPLAAGRPTTISVPLNSAAPRLTVELDWRARRGTPRLTRATLTTDGLSEPLI